MKILVTGGAGFIGSHISKHLIAQGHEVVIYDNFSTSEQRQTVYGIEARIDNSYTSNGRISLPSNDTGKRLTTIEGSLSDIKKLTESLQGVDAVIHMASFISVEESVKNPLKYADNNILGTVLLLMSMREAGVKKIVFSSSATVYGEAKSLPILEDAPLSAANPYAASKIAIEVLCESFSKTDQFDVTILRYFNPYGEGEDHQPETHAIPNFIKSALEKKPIPLYWKGEQVRDFIYVKDLAAAHIAVLSLSGYNVFNVSTGIGTKIIDVVNKLSDILGYKIETQDLGERAGDVMANYASFEKLKQATGWEAKVGLKEGLKKAVEYFRGRENS